MCVAVCRLAFGVSSLCRSKSWPVSVSDCVGRGQEWGFHCLASQKRRGGPLCAIGAACGGFGRGAWESATGSPLAGLSSIFGKDVPANRLRHFPRESLKARLSSGEASIVKVELAGGRASLTLTTRSEPHNRRAIHAEPQ
jgi:hypothetical protein